MSLEQQEAILKSGESVDILPMIEEFVDHGELDVQLHGIVLALARQCVSGGGKMDAQRAEEKSQDLASDFLIWHVRGENKRNIQTEAALRYELRKYATRRNNPEGHELWSLLSEAMHELAREGFARRLDAKPDEHNDNNALWTSASPGADGKKLNMAVFQRNAKAIKCFYPKQRNPGGEKAGAGKHGKKYATPRIIPISEAKLLVEQLLKAAGGPIPFGLLADEARRHVVLIGQYISLDDDSNDSVKSLLESSAARELYADWQEWIAYESPARADRIWQAVMKISHGQALCLYYLPKHFLAKKIVMESVGTPQRISEQSTQIRGIMALELAVERLERENGNDQSDELLRLAWTALAGKVVERLMQKCAEKGWNQNF